MRPDPIGLPSALAWHSKAYWGYDEALMQLWADQITITAGYIKENIIEALYDGDQAIGFFAINWNENELDHMWVSPDRMGEGVGRMLFMQMCDRMEIEGIEKVTIISDPHAEGFYLKMGAVEIGKIESLPAGRYLTRFEFALNKSELSADKSVVHEML